MSLRAENGRKTLKRPRHDRAKTELKAGTFALPGPLLPEKYLT